ncbi:MAG: alkaline phosphatase family protein [Tannerella sp.]|jgi:arylsulfatase A-like enzyme|nr:alkaline phosphatase family protein [Tannerella sp.]
MRRFLFWLIAAVWAGSGLRAQQQAPRLVVCITVDQLRGDYLEYFYHAFDEHGFKRLMNEGVVYHNVAFEFRNVDQASAFATLFTGANPNAHGITGRTVYSFETLRELPSLHDPEYLGNFTRDNYSPKNLLASTIGDELKIASKGRSEVYAIAPDAESAILSAGHAANGAFWIDNANGKWATTTYYRSVPWYVEKYNNGQESLTARMAGMTWQPALAPDRYRALPYAQEKPPFSYTFKPRTLDCFPRIKTSPFGNREVNRLVSQFLEYGAFGTRPCPDMLAVTFYAGSFHGNRAEEYTAEIQDTYIQLDRDIAELLTAIDRKVGLRNTLVVFTGTGYFESEEEYAQGMQLGGGEFHPKRCTALLNMYLMALYGQKNWVNGFYNGQIYLNRKAVEEEKLDLAAFQRKAADFLSEFSGVAHVTTDMTLRAGTWNEGTADLQRGTYHLGRGDLIISLQPGWAIDNDEPGERVKHTRSNAVQTPLIFMANGLRPQRIYREVRATEIAPTVTHLLRVRPPNACERIPLYEISTAR